MLNSAAVTCPRVISAREYFRYVDSFEETDRAEGLDAVSIQESMSWCSLISSEQVFLGEGI